MHPAGFFASLRMTSVVVFFCPMITKWFIRTGEVRRIHAGSASDRNAGCGMEKRPFDQLGLSADLLKAVAKMGFEEASPIQTAVIPTILEGRDVVGQSSTGSGKTAAFAIPAIERVDPKLRAVQVLVLCPTRELAVQVAEEMGKLALFKRGVMGVPIYGGQS